MSNKRNISDRTKDDEEGVQTKHTKLTNYKFGEKLSTVEAGTGPSAEDSPCTSEDGRWIEEEGGTSDSLFSEEEEDEGDDDDHREERQEHFKEDPSDQGSISLHSSQSQSPTFAKYLPSSKQEHSTPGQDLHLKSIHAQKDVLRSRDSPYNEMVNPDSDRNGGCAVYPTDGLAVKRNETSGSSKSRMKLSQRIPTSSKTILPASRRQVSSEFVGLEKQKDGNEENGSKKKVMSIQDCKLESHELRKDSQNEKLTASKSKSDMEAPHNDVTKVDGCSGSSGNSWKSSDSQDSVSPCKSFLQYLPSKSMAKAECDLSGPTLRISEGPLVSSRLNKNTIEMEKIDLTVKSNENVIKKEPVGEKDEENPELVNISTKPQRGVADLAACNLDFDRTVRDKSQNVDENDSRTLPDFIPCRPSNLTDGCETDGCNIVKRNILSTNLLVSSEKGSGETAMKNVEREIIVVDLTEPLEADSVIEDDGEAADWGCSQESETTVVISPSIKSSQETYLSPSKFFKNNSQDIFILSSPESSDATPDCIELL